MGGMCVTSGLVITQRPAQQWLRCGFWAGVAAVAVAVIPAGSMAVGLALLACALWNAVVEDVRAQRIPNSTMLLASAAVVYLGTAAVAFEHVALRC
jgi:hypothetical protein